jgi:hypothetical protein
MLCLLKKIALGLVLALVFAACTQKESNPEPEVRGVLADFLAARPKLIVQAANPDNYIFDQAASERGYAFTAERNATITHLGLQVAQPGTYTLHLSEALGFFDDYIMNYNDRMFNNETKPSIGRLAWLEVQVTEPNKFVYVKLANSIRVQAGQHYVLTHSAPNHNMVLDAGKTPWNSLGQVNSSENAINLPTKLNADFTLQQPVYMYFSPLGQLYASGSFRAPILRGLVDFAYTAD